VQRACGVIGTSLRETAVAHTGYDAVIHGVPIARDKIVVITEIGRGYGYAASTKHREMPPSRVGAFTPTVSSRKIMRTFMLLLLAGAGRWPKSIRI
jgi:hypothetical protein